MAVNNIQFTMIEIQIAKYLFKHYRGKYNPRQLARLLDINHAHANKLCNSLVDKNLLLKEQIGNSTYFCYMYSNKLALQFMVYLLSLEEKEFPKWLIVLSHSLKKFNNSIKMGIIFGSSIENKNLNDIDILLVYDTKRLKEVKKIKDEIRKSQLVEKPIRYMDMTEKDILLNKEDNIFYNILSENLIFYNSGKYVKVVTKCRK
jgi:predicted nucleotidyltransferase